MACLHGTTGRSPMCCQHLLWPLSRVPPPLAPPPRAHGSMVEAMEYVLGRRQHLEDPASQAAVRQLAGASEAAAGPSGQGSEGMGATVSKL